MEYVFTNTRDIIQTLKEELELNGREVLVSSGNSTGKTKTCLELLGATFTIIDWSDRKEMMQQNGLNPLFAEYDFKDRILYPPVNPGKAIEFDTTGVLKPYLNDKGRLDYTYSERISYQFEPIIRALKEKQTTRQAFMAVWDPNEDVDNIERRRVPCSIGYQFFIRDNQLHMIYLMRSLEVSKCLGNDIYTSSRILEYVADKVGVDNGYLQFFASSLHLFL